jgi:hypothetical protein
LAVQMEMQVQVKVTLHLDLLFLQVPQVVRLD